VVFENPKLCATILSFVLLLITSSMVRPIAAESALFLFYLACFVAFSWKENNLLGLM
jgi:hypothetical protein